MDAPLLQLEWPVASAYAWSEWLDDRNRPSVVPPRYLTSRQAIFAAARRYGPMGPRIAPVDGAAIGTRYHPMDRTHATLFRIFAALDPANQEAIRDFVSTYGWLGVAVDTQTVPPTRQHPAHIAYGESHLTWAYEIACMQEALSQWEQPKRTPKREATVDDLIRTHLRGAVDVGVTRDQDDRRRVSYTPRNLLSALWVQLMLATFPNRSVAYCKYCDRPIEISTAETGHRTSRVFCSDSCKTMEHRRRKRTALQLADAGHTVRQIANMTATRSTTIRRWIEQVRHDG